MKNDNTNKTTNIINNYNLSSSQPVTNMTMTQHNPKESVACLKKRVPVDPSGPAPLHTTSTMKTNVSNITNHPAKQPKFKVKEVPHYFLIVFLQVWKYILSFVPYHISVYIRSILKWLISQTTTVRLWSLGAMKVASTVLRINCRWYTSLAKFTLGASVFLSQEAWEVCGIQVLYWRKRLQVPSHSHLQQGGSRIGWNRIYN